MLKIITGGIRTEKSDRIFESIYESVKGEKPVLVLIPDQFSFEYDKLLYKKIGAKLFNNVRVFSFNRLAEEILKEFGSESGEYADDNAKQIMMFLAIKKLKADRAAKYYKKQLDKPSFISNALDLVKDLRQSSISPEDLQSAALNITGSLKEKLSDINALYENYCTVLKENDLKDSLTIISEASQIAKANDYFNGVEIFVDEFSSFSYDEILMLETIISQSENTTVSLTISEENNFKTKLTPFSSVISTQQKLVDIAKQYNKKLEFKKCELFREYNSQEIIHINKNIFNPIKNKFEEKEIENVNVVSSNDLYEEIEYVSTEIKRLVCDMGYKYSEIAVISRQLSEYFSIISGAFERYEIPYFMDMKQPVTQKALILYIMSIFEAVTTKSFNTEAVLRYMKSALSCFNETQISKIEDYCFQWNVSGDMWLSPFTASEKSTAEKEKDDENSYLSKINRIREAIINPLQKFKKACENASAGEICEAFYALMNEVYLTQIISGQIKSRINGLGQNQEEVIEIAREFKQLWGLLTASIKSVYDNIGNEGITLKDFYELLKLMLSQMKVATPPQKLDAVTIASAERSRLADPKVVFVIGVNEGIMPYNVKQSGLFTDKDKDLLESVGLKISKTTLFKLAEERFVAYCALSAPSDRLFVCYPTSDLSGGVRRPSAIITQLKNMFGDEIAFTATQKGAAYFCTTKRAAYYKYIEGFQNVSTENLSIRSVLDEIPEYRDKINYLENIQQDSAFSLSKGISRDLFFSNNLSISATRLESYNKCPFSYFCQYGLNLNPTKAVEINPLSRGTIVHYCLENILSKKENDKKIYDDNFIKLNEAQINDEITMLLKVFKENELGGDFGKTKRFDFLFKKLHDLIFEVVINIQKEFKQSRYVPSDFELNLLSENGKSLLEIKLQDGITVRINGKIDRVDKFEQNGKKYIRVVDYKTGEKELLFEELYHGLNLQMVLYLLALTGDDNPNSKYSDCQPAGILYMPAKYLSPSIERSFEIDGDIEIDVSQEKLKNFKMNGLVVNVPESYMAMESELRGQFIPVEKKNDGKLKASSKIIEPEIYQKLQEFARDKVVEMAENLIDGEIQAVPTGSEKYLPCDFCDYWSVCGNFKPKNAKIIEKSDAQKLKEIIGMNQKGEAGESNE